MPHSLRTLSVLVALTVILDGTRPYAFAETRDTDDSFDQAGLADKVRIDMWPGHNIQGGRPGPGNSLPRIGNYGLGNAKGHDGVCSRPVDSKAHLSNLLLTMLQKMDVETESFGDSLAAVSEIVSGGDRVLRPAADLTSVAQRQSLQQRLADRPHKFSNLSDESMLQTMTKPVAAAEERLWPARD